MWIEICADLKQKKQWRRAAKNCGKEVDLQLRGLCHDEVSWSAAKCSSGFGIEVRVCHPFALSVGRSGHTPNC
jgi:hypothetical protein